MLSPHYVSINLYPRTRKNWKYAKNFKTRNRTVSHYHSLIMENGPGKRWTFAFTFTACYFEIFVAEDRTCPAEQINLKEKNGSTTAFEKSAR